MSARAGQSWQTSLADLSLILFMATAAAVSQQPAQPAKQAKPLRASPAKAPSAQSEPVAVYIAAPDAPPLGEWLTQQAADPRLQLTITARYAPGQQARAVAAAARLLAEAGAQGRSARVVVEPGEAITSVALAYDTP